jgi:hypothetical protein
MQYILCTYSKKTQVELGVYKLTSVFIVGMINNL